jgi:nitroimidazol reductase NimA-like FMN-containing flavoprotein (pyridoxamine 5'-phosphate oxidase superfamily)
MEQLEPALPPSERTRVRRLPRRGAYDRATIDAILDEALVCHLAFAADGQPFAIPTAFARIGDHLYVHGATASRTLRAASGAPVCVTVTLLDGLVLARSAFHHSMNYRSVVVLGHAEEVTGEEERLAAMRALVDKVSPGRWDQIRPPNGQELKATTILRLSLAEASAKIRSGPPIDDEEDLALPCWAGVIPLALTAAAPIPDGAVT